MIRAPLKVTCAAWDCGEEFVLLVKDQQYYFDRGWALPKRCPKCRLYMRTRRGRRLGLLPTNGRRA